MTVIENVMIAQHTRIRYGLLGAILAAAGSSNYARQQVG